MINFSREVARFCAVAVISLAAVGAGAALAHHKEGHDHGKGGGDNSGDSRRESFNSGVLAGEMLLFEAMEDISVSSKSKPTISSSELVVRKAKNAETRAYLKFDVVNVVGTVISAKIILRSTSNSGYGGDLREVADGWSENTMTWANKPFVDLGSPPLSAVDRVVGGAYYEWDVLPAVSADGLYSFALTCDSCASTYQSREASLVPYLVVVVDDGSSVPPGGPDGQVFAGAGDIARCGAADPLNSDAQQTALLLDDVLAAHPDLSVFVAGDVAQNNGAPEEYEDCYDPTWGRHFDWTNPVPGNHDYFTPDAAGYFAYWGARAGDPTKGYYSYDIGSWHFIALNSNCGQIGGCGPGTPQNAWLRSDLADSAGASCIVAYLHHPPHSSGEHGGEENTRHLMDALHEYGADILIAGHDHNYERFTPQDADGVPDLENGVRLFVVGTGGVTPRAFRTPVANSEARFNSLNGILKLTLHPASYDWEFVSVPVTDPEPVEVFSDAGSAWCN